MRTIETNATVDEQGNLVIPMPGDIPQGEHRVVVVIDVPEEQPEQPKEEAEKLKTWPPPGFKVFEANLVDPQNTLRRKDLYDTDRG
jgi:hypothetical protein